jgi:probable F420-dependent oxidoreductase
MVERIPSGVQIVPPGTLACGLVLPAVAQSRLIAEPWERAAGPAEILRVARECDRRGFFYVAVCDHVAIPRAKAEAMSTIWYDPIATLGFVAAATERVRLLSYVYVLPYRHPLAAAKSFATLDRLSGGRVILGVGAGHLEEEFTALGIDFRDRGRLLDEAIDAVAAALTEEYPDHAGPRWRLHDSAIGPRPIQSPRPPIWVGGSTEAALRRAAARGDGWLPQGTPRMGLEAAIRYIRAHREKTRDGAPIEIGANSERLYVGTPGFDLGADARSGSGEELAARLRAMRALGVSHLGVRFRTRSCDELVEQIEAFATEVMPHLHD